jgi:hypothetical protein
MALILVAPARAQQKANTLTRDEIEKGWILLFDGETSWGWTPMHTAPNAKDWSVADCALEPPEGPVDWLVNTTAFGDFEMTGECQAENRVGAILALAESKQTQGAATTYSNRQVFSSNVPREDQWCGFRLSRTGPKATLQFAGGKSESYSSLAGPLHMSLGYFGPRKVRWRNLKLRPLGLQSIFNGKDLSGWTPVPGHQSVFSVTPEGWLNVKNGNGDLQTEKTWGDFVLQLDILSNGNHLNSGIFFRGNPGKFWEGYEAQIRNQWEGDDRAKAVDYGTGAIYNRQPARRVISSDRQWFTMTVVAHGYHLSTWVDGYQVADYTDTRPVDETNARKGARKAPGVLSIQGHDPTTDLSFRNIRVVEMK